MRRLPPLTALPAFEATARLGSVSLAASELGRTHSAVSKQIRTLADALGVDLFEKAGTGLRLTPAGARLLPALTAALDQIARAADEARGAAGRRVMLGISGSLASRWLMPRLARLQARHPGVQIDFHMAGRHPEDPDDCDVYLSWDRLRRSRAGLSMEGDSIGDVRYGLVAAPGYAVERRGNAVHVATALVPDTTPNIWQAWSDLAGQSVGWDRAQIVPSTSVMLDAAAAGLGAALTERRLVEEELDDGRLVAPCGFVTWPGGFIAFVSGRGARNPATALVVDWLRGEA